jgi:uncharacterized protein
MKTQIINSLEEIVEKACASENNIFGYGIWTHHIKLVTQNGKMLAGMFGADPEVVEIAALLHDYASVKDATLYPEHHIHGPAEAEKLLKKLGYPDEGIEAVKECIETHRGSVPRENRSREADCLANADAMTHIENVPSLMHLAYVQHNMSIDEGADWVRAKLERSWHKMSSPVQEMMREKFNAAMNTLRSRVR